MFCACNHFYLRCLCVTCWCVCVCVVVIVVFLVFCLFVLEGGGGFVLWIILQSAINHQETSTVVYQIGDAFIVTRHTI